MRRRDARRRDRAPGDVATRHARVPTLVDGAVLIRVRTVGFCGSDLNTFRGLNPLVSYPRVPGHEIAGVVEAVGADVPTPIAVGVRCDGRAVHRVRTVLRLPARTRQHLPQQPDARRAARRRAHGADRRAVAVACCAREGLDRRELALVEPLAVGFHAVARGRVAEGDVVAVIGTGAVGLGAVAGAARAGGDGDRRGRGRPQARHGASRGSDAGREHAGDARCTTGCRSSRRATDPTS